MARRRKPGRSSASCVRRDRARAERAALKLTLDRLILQKAVLTGDIIALTDNTVAKAVAG